MRVSWTAGAIRDLRHIRSFIARDSPTAADRIAARIRATQGSLSRFPALGRSGEQESTRELVVNGTPYIVMYRITPELVEIVRVIHGAQRWPPENLKG